MDFLRGFFTGNEKHEPKYEGPLLRGSIVNEVVSTPRDSSDAKNAGLAKQEENMSASTDHMSAEVHVGSKNSELTDEDINKRPKYSVGATKEGMYDNRPEKLNQFGGVEGKMIYLAEGIPYLPDSDKATKAIADKINWQSYRWKDEENPGSAEDASSQNTTVAKLKQLFQVIFEDLQQDKVPGYSKLTIARLVSYDNKAFVVSASLGDSPVFAVKNDGSISRLSIFSDFEYEEGKLEPSGDEIQNKYIGNYREIKPEKTQPKISVVQLEPDIKNVLIVSSDLARNPYSTRELEELVKEAFAKNRENPTAAAEFIVDAVSEDELDKNPNAKDRSEISVVILPVKVNTSPSSEPKQEEKMTQTEALAVLDAGRETIQTADQFKKILEVLGETLIKDDISAENILANFLVFEKQIASAQGPYYVGLLNAIQDSQGTDRTLKIGNFLKGYSFTSGHNVNAIASRVIDDLLRVKNI